MDAKTEPGRTVASRETDRFGSFRFPGGSLWSPLVPFGHLAKILNQWPALELQKWDRGLVKKSRCPESICNRSVTLDRSTTPTDCHPWVLTKRCQNGPLHVPGAYLNVPSATFSYLSRWVKNGRTIGRTRSCRFEGVAKMKKFAAGVAVGHERDFLDPSDALQSVLIQAECEDARGRFETDCRIKQDD